MKFIYLQKGGKVNGKSVPNNNDENVIPTKEDGGTDMNPKFWKKTDNKLKPKNINKKQIYKPKVKKAQQGADLNFTGNPHLSYSIVKGSDDPANSKFNLNWKNMSLTDLEFPKTKDNISPVLSRSITHYLPNTKLPNDTAYGGTDLKGNYFTFNKKNNPVEYAEMQNKFNTFLKNKTQAISRKDGGKLNKSKKCSCGCSMKISKNKSGGIIEVCSCGCGGK